MRLGFPMGAEGLKVGLLGGSFDPPHIGHLHITRRALRWFQLDQVWWMVSPGNPLKSDAPATLERRMEACRALIDHPRVKVTDIEAQLGTRYTADTLQKVTAIYPSLNFVWLMGADNLASLHRWEQWRDIMERVPVGVLARPGGQIAAGLSPAARAYARFRLPKDKARRLAVSRPPAWVLLSGPMVEASSTELRRLGKWLR